MSDDEYGGDVSSLGPNRHGGGSGSSRVIHRKGPRFSWTPAYEATFFQSLCESVQVGLKDNHSFKSDAWERAAQALQDRHGAYPSKNHLINKSDNARKKFRLWRGLREDPEFLYDRATHTVTASDEAWRAHIEKEPLSRSLRGRPFEHEDYMEVLFADVIGSGGAPKRVTKPRRKGPDALPGSDDQDTPGTAILDLLTESNGGFAPTATVPGQPQQLQQHQQLPSATAVASSATTQRPTSTVFPPRTSIASTSALTPPEETPQTRKRFAAPPEGSWPADKRRRTNSNYIDLTHPAGGAAAAAAAAGLGSGATNGQRPLLLEDGVAALVEVLRTSTARGGPSTGAVTPPVQRPWTEQAMELFFRDFADEDMDLQVKIAEKVLADVNKAMMFCKMPVALRKHWITRLREAHNRAGN